MRVTDEQKERAAYVNLPQFLMAHGFNLKKVGKEYVWKYHDMRSIVGGDASQARLPKEKKPDGFVTDMFEPEYFEYVRLRVKRYLLDDMLEHFGDYASISPYSETDESVIITVHVGVNRRFFLWVMSYGDGIELISPANVRDEYLAEVRKMLGAYPEF